MAFWNRKKKESEDDFITIKVRKRDLLPPYYVELYEKLYGLKYDPEEWLRDACSFGIVRYTRDWIADIRFNAQVEEDYEKYGEQMHDGYGRPFKKLLQMQSEQTAPLQEETSKERVGRNEEEGMLEALRKGDCTAPLSGGVPATNKRIPEGKVRIYLRESQRYISISTLLGRKIAKGGWKCWCPIFNEGEHKFFIAFSKGFSQVGREIMKNTRANGSFRLPITNTEVEKIERCLDIKFQLGGNNLVSHTPPKVDDKGLLRIYLQK